MRNAHALFFKKTTSRRLALRSLQGVVGALLLTSCTLNPFAPPPPPPPRPNVVAGTCPPRMLEQARWLMNNLGRVRLGAPRLELISKLGQPSTAETYDLNTGATVEVLYYQTLNTICRVPLTASGYAHLQGGLLPFVFQNDRLLGYGQHYYHDFIVPRMAALTTLTPAPDEAAPPPSLAPAPAAPARLTQEDLPGFATHTATHAVNGYHPPRHVSIYDQQPAAGPPSTPASTPASTPVDTIPDAADTPDDASQLGRGDPLR